MAVHFQFANTLEWKSIPVAEKSIPLWKLKEEIDLRCGQGCKKKPMQQEGFKVFYAESMEEIVGAESSIARHSYVVVRRLPVYFLWEEERLAAARSCNEAKGVEEPHKPELEAELDDGFGDDIYSTSSCQKASSGCSATSTLTAISSATKALPVMGSGRTAAGPTVVQSRGVEKVVKNLNVDPESVIKPSPEVKVPPELVCSVCHEMMKDPVLIPCCFYSFCRKCVVTAILEQHKCPQCGSSKCKDSDLLPNRNTNDRIVAHMKSSGIACDVATVSSKGSCSSQSPVPTISSEPGRGMSESYKKAVINRPPVVPHLAPQKAPCTNVGVKRKAPESMIQIRAYNGSQTCGHTVSNSVAFNSYLRQKVDLQRQKTEKVVLSVT